jgi:hypothetical protein
MLPSKHCLGKLFTAILNNRLNTYSESFLLLNENQCGFREGYSTLDCIYKFFFIPLKISSFVMEEFILSFNSARSMFNV